MSFVQNCFSCVCSRENRPNVRRQMTKIYFGARINDAFKRDAIPSQLKELLIFIAQEGVLVSNLFRRPGNSHDISGIIHDLQRGRKIDWKQYNFFTLANVAKKFLIGVKDGLLGSDAENRLINTLDLEDDQTRIEAMHRILMEQTPVVQQLLALLFGIWFRMIYHSSVNAMSVEAVAKSVAGSIFPSCSHSPEKVEKASKVLEQMITGFASPDLFGHDLIEYFAQETQTSLSRTEKFVYQCEHTSFISPEESQDLFGRMLLEESEKHGFNINEHEVSKEEFEAYGKPNGHWQSSVHQTSEIVIRVSLNFSTENNPDEVPELHSEDALTADPSASNDNSSANIPTTFHSIRRRQEARMEKRSAWFLSPPSGLLSPESLFFPLYNNHTNSNVDLLDHFSETRYFIVERFYGPKQTCETQDANPSSSRQRIETHQLDD